MAAAPIITAVSLFRLDIPLREPFVISLGPIERVQNVAVHIQTSAGLGGWGECSPFATINGETAETCLAVGRIFAQALHGKNALDIAGNVALMDRLIWANSSMKSAFDMALHDIAAQHAGQPLYQFLGGQNDKPLHTDMTVSLGPAEKMATDALRFQQQGFTVIKVKLGGHPDEDVARMGAIRQAIGPQLPLRIDANQGWPDAPTALKVLQALALFGIQHCEEPIPRWLFTELPQLSAASPIPIMADESMCSPHDAQRLIALNACPLFNVKLGKSGGLHHAANIAGQAASAGIGLQVGGFMESRLGMTAAAHLALASPAVHFCDFDTPLMFTDDPVEGGFQFGPNWLIQMPQAPGLGAAFSPRFLEVVFSV